MITEYFATLSFSGFYESIHSECPGNRANDYAKEYVRQWKNIFKVPGVVALAKLEHPREYNFSTNRIVVTLDREALRHIVQLTTRRTLTETAIVRHTSKPGFYSIYNPDWSSWGTIDVWDENQLGTLLQAFIADAVERQDTSEDWELSIAENIQGSTDLIPSPADFF